MFGLMFGLNNKQNNNMINQQTTQLFRRSIHSSINLVNTSINTMTNCNSNSNSNSIDISGTKLGLKSEVDVSLFSKQAFNYSAAFKYYKSLNINKQKKNNENEEKEEKTEIAAKVEKRKIGKLEKQGVINIIKKMNNKTNNKNNKNSQLSSDENELSVIHHYWQDGSWTNSKQKDASYQGWNYQKFCNLTIIEPNSIENIQKLAYMNQKNNKNSKNGNKKSKKKVGIFTEFLFFSHKATDALCGKLGFDKDSCDTQSIYQFEARYFQYSVLGKRIRFCKDYRNNKGKEYMIFKFGRISQIAGCDLYAICERNNRAQQPWMCQHIFTLNEMLNYFNLKEESLTTRQGFLSAMRIRSDCVSKIFDTNCECKAQTSKIGNMLNNSYQQYLREKTARDNNNKRMDYENGQLSSSSSSGWGSDELVPTRSNSSIGSGISGTSGVSILSTNNNNFDTFSIGSSSSSSRPSSRPSSARSNASNSQSMSFSSNNNNNNNKYGNGKNEHKIKNEDKFNFLEKICRELGLSFGFEDEYGYHFNHLPHSLLQVVGEAIENAIEFSRKYPNTVLTQAYIDEDHGSISYELVLIAEIANQDNTRFYKFAVPIVESTNNKTGIKCYKAENILTPKMVVDNVRLNTKNAQFEHGTWIKDISDVTTSFYKQIDSKWYDDNTIDDIDNSSSSSSSNSDDNDSDSDNSDSDSDSDSDSEVESMCYLMAPPVMVNRSISIPLDGDDNEKKNAELPHYKTQVLTRKSTSNDTFEFDNNNNNNNNNNNTIKDENDAKKFYEMGLNINNGGSQRRNNRSRNNRRNNYNNNNNSNNHYNNNYKNRNNYQKQNQNRHNYNNCNNYNGNYSDNYNHYNQNNHHYNNNYYHSNCNNNNYNNNNYNNYNNHVQYPLYY